MSQAEHEAAPCCAVCRNCLGLRKFQDKLLCDFCYDDVLFVHEEISFSMSEVAIWFVKQQHQIDGLERTIQDLTNVVFKP